MGFPFTVLELSLDLQKFFNRTWSQLWILWSISCVVWFLFMKSLPTPLSSRFLPLSSNRFSVSVLIFRYLLHLDFSLVHGDRHGSSFSFQHIESQFFQHHLLKRLLFFQWICLAPLSKIRWLSVFVVEVVSSNLFHWSSGLFLFQCRDDFITGAL